MRQYPVATRLTNISCLLTGPANFGPEMATSAVAFGPAGAIFVTLNVSGNFPSRYAFLRSWSATWLMDVTSAAVAPMAPRATTLVATDFTIKAQQHLGDNFGKRGLHIIVRHTVFGTPSFCTFRFQQRGHGVAVQFVDRP
jgi:hypothetical protein